MATACTVTLLLSACGSAVSVDCSAPRTYMPDGTSYSMAGGQMVVFDEDGQPDHGVLVRQPVCR